MARLHDLLKHRHNVLEVVGQALIGDKDVRLLEFAGHLAHVIGHIRRNEAAVEQHALLHVQADAELRGLLNGDDAILPDFVERLGDGVADFRVARGHGGYFGHLLARGDLRGGLQQRIGRNIGGLLDAAAQRQRVIAGGNVAHALAHDGVGQKRCCGRAIAGLVVGGSGGLAHHLQTHLLHAIARTDVRGNRSAVVRHVRMTLAFLRDADVAALRTDGHANRVGQLRHASRKLLAGFVIVRNFFSHAKSPFLEHAHNKICYLRKLALFGIEC